MAHRAFKYFSKFVMVGIVLVLYNYKPLKSSTTIWICTVSTPCTPTASVVCCVISSASSVPGATPSRSPGRKTRSTKASSATSRIRLGDSHDCDTPTSTSITSRAYSSCFTDSTCATATAAEVRSAVIRLTEYRQKLRDLPNNVTDPLPYVSIPKPNWLWPCQPGQTPIPEPPPAPPVDISNVVPLSELQ